MAEIRKIPPVTRFLTGSSLVISIPVLMNIVPRYMIVFFPKLVFRELEVSLAFEAICIVSITYEQIISGVETLYQLLSWSWVKLTLIRSIYLIRVSSRRFRLYIRACDAIVGKEFPLKLYLSQCPSQSFSRSAWVRPLCSPFSRSCLAAIIRWSIYHCKPNTSFIQQHINSA